jgi:peptidoglycan/xylan/chitin deacetylase (PgdA/CDA1 family)
MCLRTVRLAVALVAARALQAGGRHFGPTRLRRGANRRSAIRCQQRRHSSLTFDGGTISQYNLGYLQALQPHGVNATFLVNSGTVRAPETS